MLVTVATWQFPLHGAYFCLCYLFRRQDFKEVCPFPAQIWCFQEGPCLGEGLALMQWIPDYFSKPGPSVKCCSRTLNFSLCSMVPASFSVAQETFVSPVPGWLIMGNGASLLGLCCCPVMDLTERRGTPIVD